MKNLWLWLVVVVIAIGGYFALSGTPAGTDAGTVIIGAALGLTGDTAEWGAGELSAIKAAVANHNAAGRTQISLIVEDTKSTGAGTGAAMIKLVTVDKVDAIFGPTWGDSFQGGFPIVENAKIPTVTPSRALEAVENALTSPLLDVDISGANRALINVIGGTDMTLREAEMIVEVVGSRIDANAHIIWGAMIDENIPRSHIQAMVVIAGGKIPFLDID